MIIGGLISSMFLTLIVVPVVYMVVDKIMAKFGMSKLSKKRYIRQRMVASYEGIPLNEVHVN